MRIALDVRKIGLRMTGDEVYITNLVKNFAKLDKENEYFLCTDSLESQSRINTILGDLGSNFTFHAITPASKFLWTMYALPRFVKREKIDLLHVQYITPLTLSPQTKLITTIHDISFRVCPEYIKRKDRFALNFLIPKGLKKADRIIVVSHFTRGEILKYYPGVSDRKVITVYNGVDEGRHKPLEKLDQKLANRVRAKYGLDNPYILNVSSLQPRKNIPNLIEAFQDYIYKFNDSKTNLVLVGEKGYNYDSRIDDLLRDLTLKKRVKMIGYVRDEELPLVYAMASVYSTASIYEGFNIPLVEVMQSGVPIVGSDIPCHREVVEDSGILLDTDNIGKYSRKFNTALNNERVRSKMIKLGLKRGSFFSWEKCAQSTLEVYNNL